MAMIQAMKFVLGMVRPQYLMSQYFHVDPASGMAIILAIMPRYQGPAHYAYKLSHAPIPDHMTYHACSHDQIMRPSCSLQGLQFRAKTQ